MITLLETGRLIAPLAKQTATASHQIACLIQDEYDNSVHVHLKAFPARSNGLANEIAGHLLHHAAGIATAPRAWVILLNANELASLFPGVEWDDTEEWPCWATEHIDGLPISGRGAWTWADELGAWHDTPACIALHEWIWSVDSNASNLINTGRGEFAAIDHAEILGGAKWTAKKLADHQQRFYNIALHIAWGGTPTPQQRLAARECAARHADILQRTWPAIALWWRSMLKKREIEAAQAFLTTRSAPDWINSRL